jgi:hypothetical protein
MRNQLVILVLWIVVAFAWTATAPDVDVRQRILTFSDGDTTSLGDVGIGKQEARFFVRNGSRRTATIKSVTASCTCMELQFPSGPLKPGEARECVVTINVESGNKKTLAVVFDVEEPSEQRTVKLITYRGYQQDELRVTVEPRELALAAGEIRDVVFVCQWRSKALIDPQESIALLLRNARGAELVTEHDALRSDHELHRRYTVRLDAQALERVSADVSILAGTPVRAEHVGSFQFDVLPALVLEPSSLSLDWSSLEVGAEAGTVEVRLADDWARSEIAVPKWLTVSIEGGTLRLKIAEKPPFQRGVGDITVSATNSSGAKVSRKLKCIVDRSAL